MHLDVPIGADVMVTIVDTGTGIPPEILDRIFAPFFTTKATLETHGYQAITANDGIEAIALYAEGVKAFLAKPFTAPELLHLLSQLCAGDR